MPPPDVRFNAVLTFVDAVEHFDAHDGDWVDYWLSQPIRDRLRAAETCRRRVHGPAGRIDRRALAFVSHQDQ